MLLTLVLVVILVVAYSISTYNNFISLNNKSKEAFSTMDIYLKKRYDLIPNIVETVKAYAKHESETLENVVNARNKALSSATPSEKEEAEKEFNGVLGKLLAIVESYPDLKANSNFQELQNELSKMEGEIANSRKYYNGVVKTYNILCEKFPSNIFANIFKFEKLPLFALENNEERQNIKVKF